MLCIGMAMCYAGCPDKCAGTRRDGGVVRNGTCAGQVRRGVRVWWMAGIHSDGFMSVRNPQSVCRALACAMFTGATMVLYFRGFGMGTDTVEAAGASFLDRGLYILAFIGNLINKCLQGVLFVTGFIAEISI